ncbi:SusC/RagA family TonB-linked outer membrane protein [Flavobacterium quisquiliarum]|uniref:SusC/RagA family TonB-linked outer membrane protein n=1 Tax=Flavobacterium quisquiliarum TaxID=1834436 RepID=A0ABV8W5D2_9FLAO|nr:SusC/RagA family TonB-linked outer membrane protein [Flavobacterium quisquiliarum]MBW1655979.1 SusC/RagA family TonB-linked outer membrane protein [Flavobacterium quisquiliarum]
MNYFSFSKDGRALYCLFFAGIMLSFSSSFAGISKRHFKTILQHQIQGTVTDGTAPLPGVTIAVKGRSNNNSITDYNGQFSINVSPSDTLTVSFLGFKTINVPVEGKSKISIVLHYDTTTLQEVKINAGYYSVKEKERTGNISRITAKDIETQPVTNVLATMQGRMPGVNIIQNTGMAGSGFTVEIRGTNSLRTSANSPLYIIDGVPYSSQSIGSSYTSGNMPAQNSPLNSINPSDISSVEVLKDADATAIYGSRGANGVVLISTKKGREGKTVFSIDYSNGIGKVTRYMDVMDTPSYLAMRREAFANDGTSQYPANAYDVNGTWDQNRNTNWQKELIGGTAEYTNIQSSFSGGSEHTQFLLSGNYSKETTVFPGSFNYVRAGGHTNINHESADKRFQVSFSASYTTQFSSLPLVDFTQTALRLPPNAPALYDENGNLNWQNNTFQNPLAILNGETSGNTYDFLANTLLSYNISSGFTASGSFGYTDLDQKQMNLQPSTIYNPSYGFGTDQSQVISNLMNRSSWIIEPKLSWSKSLGNIAIDALAGSTFQQQKGDQLVTLSKGFSSNSLLRNPASATSNSILSSDENLYRYQAFFARINFNWEGRYILNFTGRRDGSSRFGPGRQFANFGAVGAAWIFSENKWMKKQLSFISFGKIRASYGTTGNDQIGDYQFLDTYSTTATKYQGLSGLQPSRLYNADFGWETNKKLELALEAGFLEDRIFTSFSLFQNRSSNQLVGIPLPGTTGFSSIQANLDAEVQNRGIEFMLRTQNIQYAGFKWTTSFNLTSIKNELLSFPRLEASTYKNQFVIGQPLNLTKVYHYTGLDPLTGTYQFEDVNKDGQITATEDKKTIKNLTPKYYGGLQNHFQYHNVELDFLFQFVKQESFNENYANPMPGTMSNQPIGVTGHWQQEGDPGPYQGYSVTNSSRTTANTRFIQSDASISDASFIRLKNISLTYELSKKWTKKVTCRLSLQGQNVLTFTKYKGIDPEFRVSGYVPPLKIYTSSIQLSF